MESTARLETRIGLLVMAGVAALVVLILLSDRITFDGSYPITVYLDDAGGLNVGSPVKLSGITIGSVESINTSQRPELGAIAATIKVKERFTISSRASLENRTSGIFGDAYLAFSAPPGEIDEPLPKDGSAQVIATSPFLDRATEQLQNILDGIADLVDERGRAEIQRLIGGSADLVAEATDLASNLNAQNDRLDSVLARIDGLAAELRETNARLSERLVTTLDEVDSTLAAVRAFSAEGEAQLAQLGTRADAFLVAGTGLAQRGDQVLAANQEEFETLVADLAATGAALRRIVVDIEAGRGLVGQALRSDALAADLNDAVITGRQLVERVADSPEIMVWGTSNEERNEARAARRRHQVRRAFLQGYSRREALEQAAAAAEAAADGETEAAEGR